MTQSGSLTAVSGTHKGASAQRPRLNASEHLQSGTVATVAPML